MPLFLRKCCYCKKEAHTQADLELFVKDNRLPLKRGNECKKCHNINSRSGGRFGVKQQASTKRSHEKRFVFKYSSIIPPVNPRTNICSLCGNVYPVTLDNQTCIHHIKYDAFNPLAHTIELCHSCHSSYHQIVRYKRDVPLSAVRKIKR